MAAVLAGEGSVLHSGEALKALAVAARSFALYSRGRHATEGYDLCGTTHCQRMELAGITPRLEAAAAATAGQLLWYAGKPAFAVYSRDCGGSTEAASALWPTLSAPYLRHQSDPFCLRAGAVPWDWTARPAALLDALHASQLRAPAAIARVTIAQRTASGRARELALWGAGQSVRISATAFRFAVGRALGWNTMRGDLYEIDGLRFRGMGAGHGVGLCQRGADQMGAEGNAAAAILAFYYPGTEVGRTGMGIHWTRLGGESVALFTASADRDQTLLSFADRQLRGLSQRTGLPVPGGIEIHVYPDVETFRNATGEPGWVAAHTTGTHIALQPGATARATLRHELVHVLMEARATAPLPVWFREGLVGYLEDPAAARADATPPADADLRQRQDATRARRAYAAATAAVAGLVRRHGEATVLKWLTTGLPRP